MSKKVMTTNMSFAGGLLAFGCGACLSVGWAMIQDKIQDIETFKRYVAHRVLGGGLFVLGMYLFSPAYLREIWLSLPEK
jgi:hypothetical protein